MPTAGDLVWWFEMRALKKSFESTLVASNWSMKNKLIQLVWTEVCGKMKVAW